MTEEPAEPRRLHALSRTWERITAAALTAAAGAVIMFTPSPTIDRLVGGVPATAILGGMLALGGLLNLAGLVRPTFVLQRTGMVLQIPVLLLFVIIVLALGTPSLALLLAAFAFRIIGQYRHLGEEQTLAQAVVDVVNEQTEAPSDPP